MKLECSTLLQLIEQKFKQNASSSFIFYNEKEITYNDCNVAAIKLADQLKQKFELKNRFVGMMFTNRPEFIISMLALIKLETIIVPINPRLGKSEIEYIIKDANIPFILHINGNQVNLSGKMHELSVDNFSISCTETPAELMGTPPSFPDKDVLKNIAVCIYTSGTTGVPKGALLSHYAILQNAWKCVLGLGTEEFKTRSVGVLPLFHSFGFSTVLIQMIMASGSIVLLDEFLPLNVLQQIAKYKATTFLGVPAMYGALVNVETKVEMPSLKICISGGAPLPHIVAEKFYEKYGVEISEGDGPTECGPATSVNPVLGRGIVKIGTVGLALDNVKFKIVDNDLKELPIGQIGEIAVYSSSNMSGYLNQPEETAKALIDGWVYTGDIGFIDKDGYVSILDRKKDMIIVGGINVYPAELEQYISKHPAVDKVAVIGRKDAVRGEAPVAYVKLKKEMSLTTQDLREYLKGKIASYKIPKEVIILDELPISSTGKIQKTVLRGYH